MVSPAQSPRRVRFGLCVDYARKEKSGKSELIGGSFATTLLDSQPMDNREKLFQEGSGGDSNSKFMGLQAKSFTSRELFLTRTGYLFLIYWNQVRSNTNQLINTKILFIIISLP
jgi:hypothetical protein